MSHREIIQAARNIGMNMPDLPKDGLFALLDVEAQELTKAQAKEVIRAFTSAAGKTHKDRKEMNL